MGLGDRVLADQFAGKGTESGIWRGGSMQVHVDSFGAGGGVRGRQRAGFPEKGRAVVVGMGDLLYNVCYV